MRRFCALILAACVLLACFAPGPTLAAPAPAPAQQQSPCAVAVQAALSKKGSPYTWGAKGPYSFDCSGLTYWAYMQAGVNIGVSTYDQARVGFATGCTLAQLNGSSTTCWAPGDLVFLAYTGGQHVALYAGSGLFMDCYNQSTGCILHNIKTDSFYQSHYWQARRLSSECGGLTIDPGTPGTVPGIETPSLETIPDMFPPVYFQVPQCNDCSTDTLLLERTPDPGISYTDPTSPFRWLAWKIYDLLLTLICYLFVLLQVLANILAAAINAILGALNAFWRFLIFAWLTIRDWLYAAWALVELARDFWQLVAQALALLSAWLLATVQAVNDMIALAGALALVALRLGLIMFGLVGWVGGLGLTLLASVFVSVKGETVPAPLQGSPSVLYQVIRGFCEGIIDSRIGWVMELLWAMCYIAAIMWIMRRISSTEGGE